MPGESREAFLVEVAAFRSTRPVPQEICLLHGRPGADDGTIDSWVRVWRASVSGIGLVQAVVDVPALVGDRLVLRDSERVLDVWRVER
jgi:hypothetical protein